MEVALKIFSEYSGLEKLLSFQGNLLPLSQNKSLDQISSANISFSSITVHDRAEDWGARKNNETQKNAKVV